MLLSATELRSGYATGDVLQDVGIAVESGEVVGVIGRNGVGKTTLMKTLIGLLPARTGSIGLPRTRQPHRSVPPEIEARWTSVPTAS